MTETLAIPESAIEERFLSASGPGGQNVNKVATAVQLRVDICALQLAPDVRERLRRLAGSRWTDDGAIVITARRFRTQDANRADARARIEDMVRRAQVRPVRRIKTKPSKSAQERRLIGKAIRSEVKKARGKGNFDV